MQIKQIRKGKRKHTREDKIQTNVLEKLTMSEMFERFMWEKQSEGLAKRTIEEYFIHFKWLFDFLGEDLSSEEMTTEVFLDYIHFMTYEKRLKPNTVNIRIRTMRAFLRWCYKEKLIHEPIYEKFK